MGRRKKKRPPVAVVEEQSYTTLKVLCAMSFVGFIISMLADTGNFISFGSIEKLKIAADQTQFEQIETKIEEWNTLGLDVSNKGLKNVSAMYGIRSFIDILAMVGVVLMYFRLKMGYLIYTLFQFIYVAIPFLFFGGFALFVVEYSSVAISLIYVALFTSQRKHLIR